MHPAELEDDWSRAHAAPTLADGEVANFRLTGPHRLSLRFHDGFVAEIGFAAYGMTGGPLKRALNDPAVFATAHLDHGILTWPHGLKRCGVMPRKALVGLKWCELG